MIDDQGWPHDDDTVMEWHRDGIVIRRQAGMELREGEWKRVNQFGLFFCHQLVCDGTFEYVSNYYWREFA